MQLITPFPRSVALADPRSAALVGACRVESIIDQSALPRSSPEASLSVQTCVPSRNRRCGYQCHHLSSGSVKSFARSENGGSGRSTSSTVFIADDVCIVIVYTRRTQKGSYFLVETQRTHTTTTVAAGIRTAVWGHPWS